MARTLLCLERLLSLWEFCLHLSRFTTESYPEVARADAWSDALDPLGWRITSGPSQQTLHGTSTSHASASGFAFLTQAGTLPSGTR
jgi:hypothetical protein